MLLPAKLLGFLLFLGFLRLEMIFFLFSSYGRPGVEFFSEHEDETVIRRLLFLPGQVRPWRRAVCSNKRFILLYYFVQTSVLYYYIILFEQAFYITILFCSNKRFILLYYFVRTSVLYYYIILFKQALFEQAFDITILFCSNKRLILLYYFVLTSFVLTSFVLKIFSGGQCYDHQFLRDGRKNGHFSESFQLYFKLISRIINIKNGECLIYI
jgi:hypothetical protein